MSDTLNVVIARNKLTHTSHTQSPNMAQCGANVHFTRITYITEHVTCPACILLLPTIK